MIALVVIATGKYPRFVLPLLDSAAEFLRVPYKPFILTDAPQLFRDQLAFPVQHRPWPFPTLMRYGMILSHAQALRSYEYVFYLDSDMVFVADVGDEILGELVATVHPRFHAHPERAWWESNPASRACVPPHERASRPYYAGGFQGGTSATFLSACERMRDSIDDDLRRGVVATWHDEGHWNRHCIDHPPTVALSPSYCHPEGRCDDIDVTMFTPRIKALTKPLELMRDRGN